METKPYNLQSPEAVAKEYGGNKQAIARAAQMGLVDPTAAVLAGMFIDRMRNAISQEQVPTQTVAQQTFAPPAPQAPAGLGATPQPQMLASAMPAPGQAPPIAAPQGQPAAQFANGGLAAIELPDDMYDYAGGGLVAFAKGEEVVNPRKRERLLQEMSVRFANRPEVLQQADALSNEQIESMLGYGSATATPLAEAPVDVNPIAAEPMIGRGLQLPGQARANLGETLFPTPEAAIQQGPTVAQEAPASGGLAKYVKEYQDLLAQIPGAEASAEEATARRGELFNTALAQFGFNLAGTPGDLLTGAAKAGEKTMPTITEGIKAARASEDTARKTRRAEQIEALKGGMTLYGKELDRAAQIEAANVSAGKGTDMSRFVDNFVNAARAKGDDKTPEAVLRQVGGERYLEIYGAAGVRGQAALTQAGVAAERLSAADYAAAQDYVKSKIGFGGSQSSDYLKAQQRDRKNAAQGNPTDEAGDMERKLRKDFLDGLDRERGGRAPSAAPAAPASAASARGAQGTKENPLSMPQRREDLVKDKVYMTARGLATWNGNQFVSVK